MRGKILLAIGLTIAAGVGLYATYQSHHLLAEHEQARLVSFQQTLSGLDTLDQAGPNAVTLALDATLFNNFGSTLVGQKVVFSHPSLPGEVLTATIERMSFTSRTGRLIGNFGLGIASDKRLFSVGLGVESVLYFAGGSDLPPVFAANFRLLPISIEPKIAFGFLNIVGRGFVSDIIAGNVVSELSEKLTLSIPYQPELKYTLDENKVFEQKFGHDNKGTFRYQISHTPVTVARSINVVAPIFSDRGVLLAATMDEKAKPFGFEASKEPVGPASQVEQLEQKLSGRISGIEKFYSGKQLTLNMQTGALSSMAAAISDTANRLSIAVASTEISGRLFDKRWSDNILGDGGFYAEAAGGDRVHGSINVGAAEFRYSPGKGLAGDLALSISGDADIHVHVDPLIGGGMGSVVKLKGSTSPKASVRIVLSNFRFEGGETLLLAPVLTCTAIELKVETDGKLKLGSGWTTVPSIGVVIGELIGADAFDPIVLSGIPAVLPVIAKTDANAPEDKMVIREGLYLSIEPTGLSIEPAAMGYQLSSNFSLQASDRAPDSTVQQDRIQRLTAAAKEYWRGAMKPNCPEKPSLQVLVGDLEFGPNNEIIKFLRNAWNDITKGPGKENEIVKALDRVNAGAKNYDDATRKIAGEMGDAARNAFPKNNDIGRAAGEVTKSMTKTLTNPGGAVKDLGHQILCGFC